jgi:ferredoxin
MCDFCAKYGEGGKWYENMTNYSEGLFRQVNSEQNLKEYLAHFRASVEKPGKVYPWKKRFPLLYRLAVYPFLTRHMKKTHFGQVVPLEDVGNILKHFPSVVRLPCICRQVTLREDKRYCLAVGMDLTHIFADLPDFNKFDRLLQGEALEYVRKLDSEGQVHSVWTFNTPFIAAICNCDRDCMAYRFQHVMNLGRIMWKAEYLASIDPGLCNGCRECISRCHFAAIFYDRANQKCRIDATKCYGCGVCRTACPQSALILHVRTGYDPPP